VVVTFGVVGVMVGEGVIVMVVAVVAVVFTAVLELQLTDEIAKVSDTNRININAMRFIEVTCIAPTEKPEHPRFRNHVISDDTSEYFKVISSYSASEGL
jgi:hypothetical protein